MTRDCWKDFAASGSVSDYLRYREQESHMQHQPGAVAAVTSGVKYGTEYPPDGHGTVRNASR